MLVIEKTGNKVVVVAVVVEILGGIVIDVFIWLVDAKDFWVDELLSDVKTERVDV